MKKKIYYRLHTIIYFLFITMPFFTHAIILDTQSIANILVGTAAYFISDYRALQSTVDRIYTISQEEHILEKEGCTEVTKDVADFIMLEWNMISSKKIDIKIHPAYSPNFPIGTGYNNMVLAQYVADEIRDALKTNNQNILNKWRAIIQHEAAHINNNDLLWRLAIDFTAYLAGKLLYIRYINNFLPTFNASWGETQLFKLHAALCIFFITESCRMAIYKYQEKRADMNVANNIQLLKDFKEFFYDNEKLTFQNHVALYSTYERYPLVYKVNRWIINFFEEHPLNSARIKKLDQRIAHLEKIGNKNVIA